MCPYCGMASRRQYSAKDWNQKSSQRDFAYRRCIACNLTFIEKIPEDLGHYYLNEQYDIPADQASFEARSDTQRWKVEILQALAAPCTFLEVGPATGEFAFAARKSGFRPELLEMDGDCCRFLRDELGLAVTQTANPAAVIAVAGKYHAICIWQAIEHIPEFWNLMREAAAHLAHGGVMILSTPNPESLQARILGRYWPHLDAPRHLYLIPQEWMRSFAEQNGLTVVLDTTRDVGSIGLNYYGWYLAVRNAFRGRISDGRIAGIAARLTFLFRRWEEAEGGGCAYTIALRRP